MCKGEVIKKAVELLEEAEELISHGNPIEKEKGIGIKYAVEEIMKVKSLIERRGDCCEKKTK